MATMEGRCLPLRRSASAITAHPRNPYYPEQNSPRRSFSVVGSGASAFNTADGGHGGAEVFCETGEFFAGDLQRGMVDAW